VHLKTPELRTHDEAFNVSEGGMAIATTNPLPVQTLVGLTVELPHAVLSVELVARVVWSTRDAMGLRFESVGAELLDGVERLRRDLDRL
jgi:Tfp pilus assembly protein PilZ